MKVNHQYSTDILARQLHSNSNQTFKIDGFGIKDESPKLLACRLFRCLLEMLLQPANNESGKFRSTGLIQSLSRFWVFTEDELFDAVMADFESHVSAQADASVASKASSWPHTITTPLKST